jgi:hypothetical protein
MDADLIERQGVGPEQRERLIERRAGRRIILVEVGPALAGSRQGSSIKLAVGSERQRG